jgi:hypothetical protein
MISFHKSVAGFWIAVAVLLVGYALSLGPSMWFIANLQLSDSTDTMIHGWYRPVFWACGKTGTFPALWWYIGLWIGPLSSAAMP